MAEPISSTPSVLAIDPSNPLPLHFQLHEILRQQITKSTTVPGTEIPSEYELARRYGISRTTVRQAVLDLVKEGFLYRKRGKGTFVAVRKVEDSLDQLASLAEDLQKMGLEVHSRALKAALIEPDQAITKKMELKPGERVFATERVRLAEGKPISLEYDYWVEPVASLLAQENLDQANYYYLVEKTYGIPLVEADQTIEGRLVTEPEAVLLEVRRPCVVLAVERLVRTTNGRIIQMNIGLNLADRYKYRLHLRR